MALPNVSGALKDWKQNITLIEIGFTQGADLKRIVVKKETPFIAVVQPASSFDLKTEPADLRGLEWIMVHIEANSPVILKLNDRIRWGQKEFSIKKLNNYTNSFLQANKGTFRSGSTYGYIEYRACEVNERNSVNYEIND